MDPRDALVRSLAMLVEAVGGPGSCLAVGYYQDRARIRLRRFYVVVDEGVYGAVLGAGGSNAKAISSLLRTRAATLRDSEPINVFVVGDRAWVEEKAPHAEWLDRAGVEALIGCYRSGSCSAAAAVPKPSST
jgi:hypothetical protein